MLNVVVATTGPLFDLDQAKAHLRVDHSDDDALIETYSDAAVARVLQYCNLATVPAGAIPEAAFRAAALLTLGDLYANREPILGPGVTLARTVTDLVDPYRWLRV